MRENNFYITTTLPYVNAPLHLGHALELVRADAFARYKRLIGYDVYFNTGTDEHGMKIYEKAKDSDLSVQEFINQGFHIFKRQLEMFGMNDQVHFIRTTQPKHIRAAQEFWKRVCQNGYIYKKNYEMKYCVGCESEKTDSELNGKNECSIHPGKSVEKIQEENYFFKYSAFQSKLLKFYEENPDFMVPDFRFNEIKNFVKNGLQDFSISRLRSKMPWGIDVPDDAEHVMYVWFDALTSYISTLGWPVSSIKNESDTFSARAENVSLAVTGDKPENLFEKYWINGSPTQYCGKDNTRFQGIMWQAMLMAAELPNTHQIVVNGFITGEGGIRMSKTIGNVVDPRDIVNEYGTDALRYFLLKEVNSFEDSSFTMERFKKAYNAGLANGLGNLASRILTLSAKYLEKCPEIPGKTIPQDFFDYFEQFDIQKAADYVWQRIQKIDKKIQKTEPFKLMKVNKIEGQKVILELVLELYTIARMLNPIMPETSEKLKELIKSNKKPETPLFPRRD